MSPLVHARLDGRTLLAATALFGAAGCATAHPVPMQEIVVTGGYGAPSAGRHFMLVRPASADEKAPADRVLVVALHGCTQDAADMARGTRLTEMAEQDGYFILYPEQPLAANPKKCWNWYLPSETAHDGGESGLLAALVDSIARDRQVSPDHVMLVGMSAGAAMAASLAINHASRYGALVMHSGVPALAAHNVLEALGVMQKGAPDAVALGTATHAAMGAEARRIPVLVIQGAADKLVNPANMGVLVTQWLTTNGYGEGLRLPDGKNGAGSATYATGNSISGSLLRDAHGRISVESWLIQGLGHAWSGGSAAGTYTDPAAPDATAIIREFLRRVLREGR